MNDRQLHLLVSPGFLGCLFVLLLNDFVLKQQIHNGLTGKLSDFAGLFIFPLFLTAFFPRLRSYIYLLVALTFIFWKSSYSQPLIEIWNNLSFFAISRTVDSGDLFALLVLPFSHAYSRISSRALPSRPIIYFVGIISVFAFTATSQRKETTAYNNEYQFQITKADFIQRMRQLPARKVGLGYAESDAFEITFDNCANRATVILKEKDGQSVIVLKEIEDRCSGGGDKQEMLQYFERVFIDKMKVEPVARSADVLDISSPFADHQQPTPKPNGSHLPVKPTSRVQ